MKNKSTLAKVAMLPILLGLFMLPLIHPSAAVLEPQLPLAQYSIDTWDSSDGLPQIRIRAIVQTRDGYLWLGTANGLVRFDGVNFTTFSIQTGSLNDDEVVCLVEDDDEALWIGTNGGGLTRLKKGQFTTFTKTNGLPDNAIRRLDKDRLGNIWIATPGGVSRFSKGVFKSFTTQDGLPNNFVTAICASSPQGVFVASGGRLNRFVGDRFVAEPTVVDDSDGRMDSMTSGADGALWMTFESSRIKCWKDGKLTLYTRDDHKSNRPGTIYEDPQGSLWIGARDGLLRLSHGTFNTLATTEAKAKLGLVLSLLADQEGNLWLGTEANGLARLRSVSIRMLTVEDGLPDNSTRCVYRDRRGDVWIGAYQGFARLSQDKLTAFTQMDGSPIPTVTSICEDDDGRLWIAAGGRLCLMENGRLTPVAGWKKVFDIKAISRDSQGRMWVGTDGDGLYQFSSEKTTVFRTQDGLANNQIRAIRSDRQGALWIGTSGGLSRYQDGKFTNYTVKDGLGSDRIVSLCEDADGVLWVGTRSGLSRYQNGRFFTIHESDGLPDNFIFNVLDDSQGSLWLSGGRGICRVPKADLNALAGGKKQTLNVMTLGYRDGLRTVSLVAGNQPNACIDESGRLLFCSLKGLIVVSPGAQTANRRVPPVFIENVLINKQKKPIDQPADLPPGPGEVEIHYTALSYVAPEKVRFKYQLEGKDTAWVDAGQRRFAYYASLPPGSYQFHVIGCNNDGVWNQTGATYAFRIRPQFHQAKWFPVLLLLLLTGLAAGGYQLRIQRLQAHERELQRRVDEAMAQVKILSGLLPICSSCKKIRDDKGYWNQIEIYLKRYSDIEFSHGVCPDCLKLLYPEIADEVLDEMKAEEESKQSKPDPS
jgi:ligand-binding sensor domain-containing protein